MKKACVIGWPIAHSRSPIIHNYWLAKYGLEGLYERRPVTAQDLPEFLQNLGAHGYVGCNVTIPHKEEALQHIDHIDDVVRRTGSLNTVYLVGSKTHATSTDGEGFYQNLITTVPGLSLQGKRAILIGAGGSAKAIIERLLRAGITEIAVINRTPERIQELKVSFGSAITGLPTDHFVSESKSTALLVNATSQGMAGQPKLMIDLSALPPEAVVADLVYVPLETDLLKAAKARGLRTVGGLGMLLHQAVVGFEKWFGVRPEVTAELYQLVAADILKEHKS
ncbi:MAG: shikimate dehydrogenase [Aestuariivirga sp.]